VQITLGYLQEELANMEKQRDHTRDLAVASQAAVAVLRTILARLHLPDEPVERAAEQ
jgi:hypothetical protein